MLPLLWRKCSTKCCQQSFGALWPPIQNSELACRIPGASGAKAILPRFPNLCFGWRNFWGWSSSAFVDCTHRIAFHVFCRSWPIHGPVVFVTKASRQMILKPWPCQPFEQAQPPTVDFNHYAAFFTGACSCQLASEGSRTVQGASRSINARNKLLCDDAVHDAVVVAVAVFCLRRCCCWSVLCFVEFSLGKTLDSNNIEHCSAF